MSLLSRLTRHALPAVDVATAHDRPRGTLLIDVREPSEWRGGHAPGALHVPLGSLNPAKLPKADRYFLVCRSGNRSARATRMLLDAGLDAHNVDGGMTAWTRDGLPVASR